jgi:hypothetical protein
MPLQPRVEDKHNWRLSTSGKYSAKSAYNALFQGSIPFNVWERIWKSWAPNKCRFLLWLVAHNRCWTTERLARRDLPHLDRCPLCDQEEETIHHLLVTCVFTRQFLSNLLQRVGLLGISPEPSEISFDDWWGRVITSAPSTIKGGLNSLFVLGAWTLWWHWNDCVFNGVSPRLSTALAIAREEAVAKLERRRGVLHCTIEEFWFLGGAYFERSFATEEAWVWCMAGARGLPLLTATNLAAES